MVKSLKHNFFKFFAACIIEYSRPFVKCLYRVHLPQSHPVSCHPSSTLLDTFPNIREEIRLKVIWETDARSAIAEFGSTYLGPHASASDHELSLDLQSSIDPVIRLIHDHWAMSGMGTRVALSDVSPGRHQKTARHWHLCPRTFIPSFNDSLGAHTSYLKLRLTSMSLLAKQIYARPIFQKHPVMKDLIYPKDNIVDHHFCL